MAAAPNPIMSQSTYLGFDFGVKKIGVAVGESTTGMAHALETLRSVQQHPDWEGIERLIATWQPAGLVVGLSCQEDGEDNLVTPRMRKFCRQLHGRFHLPVFTIDERLSTFEAKQLLFDEARKSASKMWQIQDQLAAQLLLQTWLNEAGKPGTSAS